MYLLLLQFSLPAVVVEQVGIEVVEMPGQFLIYLMLVE